MSRPRQALQAVAQGRETDTHASSPTVPIGALKDLVRRCGDTLRRAVARTARAARRWSSSRSCFPPAHPRRGDHPVRHRPELLARHEPHREPGCALGGSEQLAARRARARRRAAYTCRATSNRVHAPLASNSLAKLQQILRCSTLQRATTVEDLLPGKTRHERGRSGEGDADRAFILLHRHASDVTLEAGATMRLEQRADLTSRGSRRRHADVACSSGAPESRPGRRPVRAAHPGDLRHRLRRDGRRELVRPQAPPPDAGRRGRTRRAAPPFVGCFRDPARRTSESAVALGYARDTLRPGKLVPGSARFHDQSCSCRSPRTCGSSSTRTVLASGRRLQSPARTATAWTTPRSADPFGDPCNERYLDAKATDEDAPPLWGLIPSAPSPKKARVEIRQDHYSRGRNASLGRSRDRPAAVVALFVNEDTGQVFETQRLISADDPLLPWSEWRKSGGSRAGSHARRRERKHGDRDPREQERPEPATRPLRRPAACSSDPGLYVLRRAARQRADCRSSTVTAAVTGAAADRPIRQVELGSVGCPAERPRRELHAHRRLRAGIRAVIDFGVPAIHRPPIWIPEMRNRPGSTRSRVSGPQSRRVTLTRQSTSRRSPGARWSTSRYVELGQRPRTLRSRRAPTFSNTRRTGGNFNKVAAPYVANSASGPIQYLEQQHRAPLLTPIGRDQRPQRPITLHGHRRAPSAAVRFPTDDDP